MKKSSHESSLQVGGGEGPRGKTELALMDAGRSAAKEHGKDCAESREAGGTGWGPDEFSTKPACYEAPAGLLLAPCNFISLETSDIIRHHQTRCTDVL